MPFIIMRRRLDVPNALWECHEFFYEDEDSYYSHMYFVYHNSYYSSDGYFPQSLKTMEELSDEPTTARENTIKAINKFVKDFKHKEIPGRNSRSLELPHFFEDTKFIHPTDDLNYLGITLAAGTAEDASSTIWDLEQPNFFPQLGEWHQMKTTQFHE